MRHYRIKEEVRNPGSTFIIHYSDDYSEMGDDNEWYLHTGPVTSRAGIAGEVTFKTLEEAKAKVSDLKEFDTSIRCNRVQSIKYIDIT
jgi:hypothetical protein